MSAPKPDPQDTRGVTGLSNAELIAGVVVIVVVVVAHAFLIATKNDAEGLARLITLGAMVLGVGGAANRKVDRIARRQQTVADQVSYLTNGGGDLKFKAAVHAAMDERAATNPSQRSTDG